MASGKPLSPSTHAMKMSCTPRLRSSVTTCSQNLEPSVWAIHRPSTTLAHITTLEQPQAGLLLVQCRGEQRFRIDRPSQLKHGLWVADVSLLPPDRALAVPDDLQHVARALRQVYAGLRVQSPGAPLPAVGSEQYDDCAWVSNRWCELLPLPAATRQQLMSLDNPLLRLELVADVLGKTGIGAPNS